MRACAPALVNQIQCGVEVLNYKFLIKLKNGLTSMKHISGTDYFATGFAVLKLSGIQVPHTGVGGS